ncbi:MAG: S16 family serine protease [Candidatus Bathyarchaeia archaeon]
MESPPETSVRRLKIVLMLSILVNATMGAVFLSNIVRVGVPEDRYNELLTQNQNLTMSVNSLRQELAILQSQLSFYKSQAEYYSRLSMANRSVGGGVVGRSEVNLVAVREATGSFGEFRYEGVVMAAHLELREGEGRLLINTKPKIGIDLQTSASTAILVVENITGISLKKTDIILTVTADRETEIVDGPSAGAALTVSLLSAVRNQTLDSKVYLTGTINPDGSIGKVGGILEKALAAARFGAKRFLVPAGQGVAVTYKVEETHPAPGFTIITTKPEIVNVDDYLRRLGFNVEVIEVGKVDRAYSLAVAER